MIYFIFFFFFFSAKREKSGHVSVMSHYAVAKGRISAPWVRFPYKPHCELLHALTADGEINDESLWTELTKKNILWHMQGGVIN